jgi:hypothetical protein
MLRVLQPQINEKIKERTALCSATTEREKEEIVSGFKLRVLQPQFNGKNERTSGFMYRVLQPQINGKLKERPNLCIESCNHYLTER